MADAAPTRRPRIAPPPLSSLRKRAARLFRRRHASFVAGGAFFKVLVGPSARAKWTRELTGVRHAREHWPWLEATPVANGAIVAIPGLVVLRSPLIAGASTGRKEALKLVRRFFGARHQAGRTAWAAALSPQLFSAVWPFLPAAVVAEVEAALGSLQLPVTGCHGDLGRSNVLATAEGGLFITDWEGFRPGGSFVEDACRLVGTVVRRGPGTSDVHAIAKSGVFRRLTRLSGYSERQMTMIYVLSQATVELAHYPGETVAARLSERVAGLRVLA